MAEDSIARANRSIVAPSTSSQTDSHNRLHSDRATGEEPSMGADASQESAGSQLGGSDNVLDYAASHNIPGLPPSNLRVVVGGIYRLMCNFSFERGLVKNVRGVVTHVGEQLVSFRILRPNANDGPTTEHPISRVTFLHTLQSGHTLQRRQFPLDLAYATTIYSSQGQTLDRVGVDLTAGATSSEQAYTAFSRVQHRDHARVLLREGQSA